MTNILISNIEKYIIMQNYQIITYTFLHLALGYRHLTSISAYISAYIFQGWKVDEPMMTIFKQCLPKLDHLHTIK